MCKVVCVWYVCACVKRVHVHLSTRMHVCICVHYVYVHLHTRVCVHVHVCAHECACVYVRMHGHAMCAHTCAQVCVHACACLCVRVCAWAYVCMCRGQRASNWVPSALVPEFKGRHSMWGVIGEGFPEAAGPGGRGQRGIHHRHAAQQS